CARANQPLRGQVMPALAGIVGAIQSARVRRCFNDRVYAIRVRGRHGNSDTAHDPCGESMTAESSPRVATVRALVDRAAWSAAPDLPRQPLKIPHGGVQDA